MTARPKVLVAMSGGVDSSVAAALLVRQGFDCVGVTMKLHEDGTDLPDRPCCSLDATSDARRVAGRLGIPHYVLNMVDHFHRDVVRDFAQEYARGRTPIPCVRCNTFTKFSDLVAKADALGIAHVATGHYARVMDGALARGLDDAKDQTYFLWGIDRRVVPRLVLPVGGMTKAETRAIARELELPRVADKPESQEICFVPDGDYLPILRRELGPDHPSLQPGPLVHVDGTRLGDHDGHARYTIGQRRGLPGGSARPLYVVAIRPQTREVVVGPRDALLGRGVTVHAVNWLVDPAPAVGAEVRVRVRHRAPLVHATVTDRGTAPDSGQSLALALYDAVSAITPGQSLVLYDAADRVLGGGVIETARS